MQVPRRDAWRWFPPFTRSGVPGQPRAAKRACAHDESERGRIESDGRSRDREGFWDGAEDEEPVDMEKGFSSLLSSRARFDPLNYIILYWKEHYLYNIPMYQESR